MPTEAPPRTASRTEPAWVRWLLISLAVFVLTVLVIVPVVSVFVQAFADGWDAYWRNLGDAQTLHAIQLTLVVALSSVLLNTTFGVAAAWAIARFRFPGRTVLITLIDLPFAVSPVVAGLVFVLLFGLQGYLGPWLIDHNIQVLHTTLGLILVTTFVTFPFVARELIPVLEAVGPEEEVAALSLGAKPWQMFCYVTLPNIKWGLLYGIILCNARAMGEFGAAYVVAGRVEQAETLPLRVNRLMEGYNSAGSFAVASVLTLLALVTLALKVYLERKVRTQESGAKEPT